MCIDHCSRTVLLITIIYLHPHHYPPPSLHKFIIQVQFVVLQKSVIFFYNFVSAADLF
jgi:hypothetical protein